MKETAVKKYPVTVFFILAFIISWSAIWLIFGSEGIPATTELQQQIGMTILLGPVIAGLLLIILYDGSKGLRKLGTSLVKWRASAWWYVLALFTAPLSTLVCIELLSLFTSAYTPAVFGSGSPSELIMLGIIGGITIGLLEEVGWTGFAVPRLLKKYNIYTTGLIVGLLWGAWHFILFWEDDSFTKTIPFLLLLTRLFSWLPAYRILMVWVYDSTQSLLIIILMHASLVASLATLDPAVTGTDLLIFIIIRAAIVWAIVGLIAIARKRKMSDS